MLLQLLHCMAGSCLWLAGTILFSFLAMISSDVANILAALALNRSCETALHQCVLWLQLQAERAEVVEIMAGNATLPGMDTAAHCYCGHQFGNFAGQLGDGAAIYLGEVCHSGC